MISERLSRPDGEVLRAGQTRDRVAAALVEANVASLAQELGGAGADVVYLSESEFLTEFQANTYLKVYQDIGEVAQPHTILFPADAIGMGLAPRLAYRLGAGLVIDCVDFEIRDEHL